MTRENFLFAIIGLLFGVIVGFMFASTMSQRGPVAPTPAGSQNLPADHPQIGSNPATDPKAMQAEVTALLAKAKNEPNNFEAQLTAADLHYQIQRYDSAIEFLMKANKLRPDDFRTLVNLGLVNLDAGHYEAAEKWYRAALAKQPDHLQAVAGLCAATLGQGDAKAAEQAIAQLEKLDASSQDLPQFRERLASLKAK